MKTIFNSQKKRFLLALVTLILIVALFMVGGGFSKYRTQMAVANSVEYSNTLAESFRLLDHPMTELEDGSYEIDASAGAQPTDGYTFKLIPGITIPASPYIEIKGKTEIPAYLYLELDWTAGVDLDLGGDWTLLTHVDGKKNGLVYVYKDGMVLTGEGGEDVLTIPTFTVDTLSTNPDDLAEGEIKICAYMLQKVEDKSAEDTYSEAPTP